MAFWRPSPTSDGFNAQARDYIVPLNMNGLQGRMLRAPAESSKSAKLKSRRQAARQEILLVYGHHAKLERWWGLVENLRPYGTVTMPDLPGFGGMQSFRKLGQKPTLDNYADYLAAFVRLKYKRRRLTIIGISFGFAVATRMLQRYPDLAKKVDLLVSMVGFMHYDDFLMPAYKRRLFRVLSRTFALPPVAWFIRYACLNGPVIRNVYARMEAGKRRLSTMDPFEVTELMKLEVNLWQINDVRTHWYTTYDFLNIDNCRQRVDLPVWHIASQNDHYLDAHITQQHMLVVFNDYHQALIDAKAHTPNLNATKEQMAILLPPGLRKQLQRLRG